MTGDGAERASVREVLGVAEFRSLLLASGLSSLGDQVTRIAVAVLVYERTGSAFLAAATMAVSFLAWLVAGPTLSALADRWPRRELMIWCDVGRALLVASLIVHGLPLWMIFALLIGVGVLTPPFESAKGALLPQIATEDQYVAANAVIGAVRQGAMVAGFLVGGLLVSAFEAEGALAVDAATFLISALLLRTGVRQRPGPVRAGTTFAREVIDGLALVASSSQLLTLLSYGVLGSVLMVAPEGMAVPVADRLGGEAPAVGVLTASVPAGFLLGSYVVLRVPVARRERLLFGMTSAACLPLLLTPLSGSVSLTALLWMTSGVFSSAQLIANSCYMLQTPENVRGRAFGIAVTIIMASQGVVLLAVGGLAEIADPRDAVALAAAVTALLLLPLGLQGRRSASALASQGQAGSANVRVSAR